MANITRWTPFRGLRRRDPFIELREMQRDMDRLFDQFFSRDIAAPGIVSGWMPLIESYKKGDNLVVKCELPGVDLKDVDVNFDESSNELVIKGERKHDTETREEDYLYRELAYGAFERRFTLPAGAKVDQMKAKYSNGLLEITVPSAAGAGLKKIEIESVPSLPEGEKTVKKAA